MSRIELTENRLREGGIPVSIALAILAPVIFFAFQYTGVNQLVSKFPGEATLLTWSIVALLVATNFTRGVAQILLGGLAVLSTPLLLGRLFHAAGVTYGMTSPTEAVIVTCAGISVLMVMSLAGRGMPIVAKELYEQSARRRTYVMRLVYGCLAFLAAFSFSFETLHRAWDSPYAILGKGQELFGFFVGLQFFGIYLFMPAMCCNLITSEKERDTLSLLFLTRLSPWGILIGKFLSRFLTMLFFISLSLPLFGYAYSLGGFETGHLWAAVWVLFVTTLQVGSLALLCSCWFRRTVGAFIASYVFGFLMLFGPLMFEEWTGFFTRLHIDLVNLFQTQQILGFDQYRFATMFFAPVVLWQYGPMGMGGEFLPTVMRTIPMLCLSAMFLVASRLVIVRRATAPPRNILLSMFRLLDRLFVSLNDQFGRGIVLTRDTGRLPEDRPIAWRETTHRTLGTTRYLIRIFIAMEFPVILICAMSVGIGSNGLEIMSVLVVVAWILVALLICGASTSLISAERSGQTFDALLTTPLTNREILTQKFVGVRRLMFVLAIPLLTIYGFETMLRFDVPSLFRRTHGMDRSELAWCYALTSVMTVLIYLPLISWLSFWIGLKVSGHGKAIMISVATLVGWCLIPLLVLLPFVVVLDMQKPGESELLMLVSPMMIIPFNEFGDIPQPWSALLINSGVYGLVMLTLRFWCQFRAARVLGRADTQAPSGSV